MCRNPRPAPRRAPRRRRRQRAAVARRPPLGRPARRELRRRLTPAAPGGGGVRERRGRRTSPRERRAMPLHPQCRALLDEMEAAGVRPFEELSVPEARGAAGGVLPPAGDPPAVPAGAGRYLPGPPGDIHVRVYTPEGGGPRGGIVFFH